MKKEHTNGDLVITMAIQKNKYISSSVSVHSKDFGTRRESFSLKFTVSNP